MAGLIEYKAYYAGYVDFGKKVCHKLVSLEPEKYADDINFVNKGIPHIIGQHILVKFNADNTFKRETLDTMESEERRKELRIKSNLEYDRYSTRRARERAKKMDNSLDDLTLRELKEWCKGSWQKKEQLRQYLIHQLRL